MEDKFIFIKHIDSSNVDNDRLYVKELDKTFDVDYIHYICSALIFIDDKRIIFSESLRQYCIVPGCIYKRTCAYGNIHYLYNESDGFFYMHLYHNGKHYAIAPRDSENPNLIYMATKPDGTGFKGMAVESFENYDAWEEEYNKHLNDPDDGSFKDFEIVPSRQSTAF